MVSYLRPSNIDGAKHDWAVLALLVKRLRQTWPDVRITLRADLGCPETSKTVLPVVTILDRAPPSSKAGRSRPFVLEKHPRPPKSANFEWFVTNPGSDLESNGGRTWD